jgi:hypothetical protein
MKYVSLSGLFIFIFTCYPWTSEIYVKQGPSFMGANLYMLVELIKPTPVLVILPRYRRHNSIFTKYLENDTVMRTKSPKANAW